jgi:hypothetical protein
MSTTQSIEALRRANPRARAGFQESVEAVAEIVRGRTVTTFRPEPPPARLARGRVARVSLAVAPLAAGAALAAFVLVGSHAGGRGIENAEAAARKAATLTATSAERSGTAVVRIEHNGELWSGTTIRWHGDDLAVSSDAPRRRGRAGSELRLVGGTLYTFDPADGGWVDIGSPESIDPGSGTTPAEYLAAVREDVGGVTLRRIIDGMTGLTTRHLSDGSTVYNGTVAAGLVARESGFKEGRPIRVLPFGYVAHDDAAHPGAPLGAAVAVGAEGIVRQIVVMWGARGTTWRYAVTYSRLGATAALEAPRNARSLLEERRAAIGR